MIKHQEGSAKKAPVLGLKPTAGSKYPCGDSRSVTDASDDEKARGPVSPLAWLCDFTANTNNRKTPNGKMTSATRSVDSQRDSLRDIKDFHMGIAQEKQRQQVDFRSQQALYNSFFAESDEEAQAPSLLNDNLSYAAASNTNSPLAVQQFTPSNQPTAPLSRGSQHSASNSLVLRQLPPHSTMQGEARIVAPNVSKLSPQSAVEVRLQSNTESVAVLCSVDVLKMRSTFFHDLLLEQERSSALLHNDKTVLNMINGNIMWREPISIPEPSPFEAAAFLESLHEGRALFRGEWNLCWARLSVSWVVEELVAEFASQIEVHMDKITSIVSQHHWRTNPNVLLGMRVAVFRKTANPSPTVVTGLVVEATNAIAYSKLRIAFDADSGGLKNAPPLLNLVSSPLSPHPHLAQAHAFPSQVFHTRSRSNSSTATSVRFANNNNNINLTLANTNANATGTYGGAVDGHAPSPILNPSIESQYVIGDISEPFWIQHIPSAGQALTAWQDPDDYCHAQVQAQLTATDLKVFWEMVRALLELPELSLACKRPPRSGSEVVALLQRAEFRLLWGGDGAAGSVEVMTLVKDLAADLLKHAYVNGFGFPPGGLVSGNGGAGQNSGMF